MWLQLDLNIVGGRDRQTDFVIVFVCETEHEQGKEGLTAQVE